MFSRTMPDFNWRSEDDWRQMAPDLHVADPAWMQKMRVLHLGPKQIDLLTSLLRTEGYFQMPPQQFTVPMERLAATVQLLVARGIPPAFAFVYDEFWATFYGMHNILSGLLGGTYQMLPDFWVWHVDPERSEAGWSPHRDKGRVSLFPDGSPKSLTVWMPLTDATPLNGCMYLLPADRDPFYNTEREGDWKGNIPYADIRALPAAAGSVLSWNQAVLHWGARSNARATAPRISMAFEFQRGDVAPFNQPMLPPLWVWPLEPRLWLIAKQILQYKHMYPLSPEMEQVAQEMQTLPVT